MDNNIDFANLPPVPLFDLPAHNPYKPIDKQDADEVNQDSEEIEPEDSEEVPYGFPVQQGMDDKIYPGELDQLTGLQ